MKDSLKKKHAANSDTCSSTEEPSVSKRPKTPQQKNHMHGDSKENVRLPLDRHWRKNKEILKYRESRSNASRGSSTEGDSSTPRTPMSDELDSSSIFTPIRSPMDFDDTNSCPSPPVSL